MVLPQLLICGQLVCGASLPSSHPFCPACLLPPLVPSPNPAGSGLTAPNLAHLRGQWVETEADWAQGLTWWGHGSGGDRCPR
jgi:hypothetical protein